MKQKMKASGISTRNKKKNNHKKTKKGRTETLQEIEEKSQKTPKFQTDFERCYISNKNSSKVTPQTRLETIKKFQQIRKEMNNGNDRKERINSKHDKSITTSNELFSKSSSGTVKEDEVREGSKTKD